MRLLAAVGLALLLAGLTAAHVPVWQSDVTVWCDAARHLPTKPRPLNNCALAELRIGRADRALPLLEQAVDALNTGRDRNRHDTLWMAVQSNRVLALVALQRRADAAAVLRTLNPDDPRTLTLQSWFPPAP